MECNKCGGVNFKFRDEDDIDLKDNQLTIQIHMISAHCGQYASSEYNIHINRLKRMMDESESEEEP